MSVQKSSAEKYVIYTDKMFKGHNKWLATIFLDNEVGEISVQSDWGNYAYGWYAPGRGKGRDLKSFLISCNSGYVMEKFGYDGKNNYFYGDKTVNRIKKDILSTRRSGGLTKEDARLCWDDLKSVDSHANNANELYSNLELEAPFLVEKLYDGSPFEIPWISGTHPQLVAFMEKVWPIFIEELKKETAVSYIF